MLFRKYIVLFILGLFTLSASAAKGPRMQLNTVRFQLQAQAWASSKTAKVVIQVNAALKADKLGSFHQSMLKSLQRLSPKAQWHITNFSRRQNSSGLEQLQARAEARLPDSEFATLRAKTKEISQPGVTYTIAAIDFVPSMADVQKTKATLRQKIYQQAADELARLNKVYSQQQYVLHRINFGPVLRPLGNRPRVQSMALARQVQSGATLSTSSRVTLTAIVSLAAKMKPSLPKAGA